MSRYPFESLQVPDELEKIADFDASIDSESVGGQPPRGHNSGTSPRQRSRRTANLGTSWRCRAPLAPSGSVRVLVNYNLNIKLTPKKI